MSPEHLGSRMIPQLPIFRKFKVLLRPYVLRNKAAISPSQNENTNKKYAVDALS